MRFRKTLIVFLALVLIFGTMCKLPVQAASGDIVVYVTNSGDCYHEEWCYHLRSRNVCTLQEAVDRGLYPCEHCNPPRLDNTSYTRSTPVTTETPAERRTSASLISPSVTTKAIPAMTAEQAVQSAYAVYISHGIDSATAMSRIQSILPQLASNPESYQEYAEQDIAAISKPTASSVASSGNSTTFVLNAVSARIHMPDCPVISKAKQNNIVYTNESYGSLIAKGYRSCETCMASTPAAAPSSITLEQAVQQSYLLYIQAGFDSNTAMALTQAIIPQLQIAPANYASVVQMTLATAGL